MAYLNFRNCTRQEYENVLYSQDAKHKIKILFNNVELNDADRHCEKLTIKSRIIPNGAKSFSLNNFISKELELILHDINPNIIQDQVSISIGTLVNNVYEYVPIGIFNIQDTPTNDKNKTTIKLRDNSVKFDFNYNAEPLIDSNDIYELTTDTIYQAGTSYYKYENNTYTLLVVDVDYKVGDAITSNNIYIKYNAVTKLQILQDICTKAGVTCNISSFIGSTDLIGIYDNTITARQYIADLAENAGRIATIDRNGELIFVDINNLVTWNIPLSIVEKYEKGKPYKIGKVVFEDGIIRYETPSTNYNILYLDASNPYINSQTQVSAILEEVNAFEIDSATTGKILGNPAIDGYDLINIYNDKVEGNPTILKTLATSNLVYNGVLINTFDTPISEEERDKNVTILGEDTFKKWARTTINKVNGTLSLQAGQINDANGKINSTTLQLTSQGALLNVIANNSNIDVTYDGDGNPVSGEVTEVTTTTGFKFNAEGMTIEDDITNFKALHRNTGTYYKEGNNIVGQYTKDGSKQKDLQLFGVYYYGMEDIDATPMFVAQLFTDERGDVGFGHFYNRGDY